MIRDLALTQVQVDELWTFVKKSKHIANRVKKRVATADDVAAAIVSCATHLTFSTGTTIVVDGGVTTAAV